MSGYRFDYLRESIGLGSRFIPSASPERPTCEVCDIAVRADEVFCEDCKPRPGGTP